MLLKYLQSLIIAVLIVFLHLWKSTDTFVKIVCHAGVLLIISLQDRDEVTRHRQGNTDSISADSL